MRIALAQVPHSTSFAAGLEAVRKAIAAAAAAGAGLVCLPECCLKGMRGTDSPVEALTAEERDLALAEVRVQAAAHRIHVVLPTERPHDGACRAAENHVWFASVNFALPVQDCATSVVSPDGECVAAGPLHREALVVADVDPAAATGHLARRFAPERYQAES